MCVRHGEFNLMQHNMTWFLRGTAAAAALATLALAPQASHAQVAPGATFSLLHTFGPVNNDTSDGSTPLGGLAVDSSGNLFGTTEYSGANKRGTVYEITTAGKESLIDSLDGSVGPTPTGSLVLASDGNFYGTTHDGGDNEFGSVFKITPTGKLTTIYSFENGDDGEYPLGSLVIGPNGNFYGTTVQGGAKGDGTVFEVTASGDFTILHTFTGSSADGNGPRGDLVVGSDGNFYGTTTQGGQHDLGIVYKMTPAGVLTVLHSFAGASDGTYPYAGLAVGTDGGLYGVTNQGGANGSGTIFKVSESGVFTLLYTFSLSSGTAYAANFDGSGANEPLILGKDGNFYGTTEFGGAHNHGTVFQFTPAGRLTTLFPFGQGTNGSGDNADGSGPQCKLLEVGNGVFYGTTTGGGANGGGTIFSIAVSSNVGKLAISTEPTILTGGSEVVKGSISLASPAPSGGAVVALKSGNTQLATVPASVTVPAGGTTATFDIMNSAVTSNNNVTITAAYNGASAAAQVTLTAQPSQIKPAGVFLSSTSVVGGTQVTRCRVYLNGNAPEDTTVDLASDNTSVATVPASVIVRKGYSSYIFTVTTQKVAAPQTISITASITRFIESTALKVTPASSSAK